MPGRRPESSRGSCPGEHRARQSWRWLDSLLVAAVVFVTIPSVVLFFLGQKQFIKGIAASGLK